MKMEVSERCDIKKFNDHVYRSTRQSCSYVPMAKLCTKISYSDFHAHIFLLLSQAFLASISTSFLIITFVCKASMHVGLPRGYNN